jgi:signal transduction histidine kinase/ActR/RegA family two-component response regulator
MTRMSEDRTMPGKAKDHPAFAKVLAKAEGGLRAWFGGLPPALAIGLGFVPADPEYAGRLRAAQIAAIVRLTPVTMAASCLNAAILLLTLGRMGWLRIGPCIWAAAVFATAAYYGRNWRAGRHRQPNRQAASRTMRRVVFHGGLFGALWGVVPVLIFPGAPTLVQLLIGCLTAGMMGAGGFVLATVPLAGMVYVLIVGAGAFIALLQNAAPVYLGLTALLVVYMAVVIVNLNWIAFLFISHFLAEAQVQREVAARERSQAQAAHAERMIALGELAGGIAHDFNNVLQVISGQAEMIERRRETPKEVLRLARLLRQAAERGGSIGRRLLAFARRDILDIEPVDLAGVLKGLRDLLGHPFASDIVIRVAAEPGLGAILADKAQLEAVLLNLAANARDAMPKGGELTFSAASETVAQDRDDPILKAGPYVRISVADSGTGMDPATLRRATEPFFTTKPMGKGTGLGLSIAQGFAQQSGGALALRSEPGRGTVVSLWLPRAEGVVPAPPGTVGQIRDCAGDPARRPLVLVVDDDEFVRETVMMSLERAGFAAEGAADAADALACTDRGKAVDAVITDFYMPGMNGLDLIREMQKRYPALPAILLTGHVGDIAAATARVVGSRVIVLQKPVPPSELAERLTVAIASRRDRVRGADRRR